MPWRLQQGRPHLPRPSVDLPSPQEGHRASFYNWTTVSPPRCDGVVRAPDLCPLQPTPDLKASGLGRQGDEVELSLGPISWWGGVPGKPAPSAPTSP